MTLAAESTMHPDDPQLIKIGEITLKFGTAAGAPPLKIPAGPINIIVGPNNAGKSVFLRELSGINPRARASRSRHGPTKIIEKVDWTENAQRQFHEQILSVIIEKFPDFFRESRERTWNGVISGLEQCSHRMTKLRSKLASNLRSFAEESLSPQDQAQLSGLLALGDAETTDSLLIILSLFALAAPPNAAARTSAETTTAITQRGNKWLTPENHSRVLAIFETNWAEFCAALRLLDVDTEGLQLAELLNINILFSTLRTKLAELPQALPLLLGGLPGIVDLSAEDAANAAVFARYQTLGSWLLAPSSLLNLRDILLELHRGYTWHDDDFRKDVSESSLFLDGLARLDMTSSGKLSPFEKAEDSNTPPILSLLKDPERTNLLRDLVFDALGLYLVIDLSTQAPKVIWRLSRTPPPSTAEVQYTAEANDYFKSADLLDDRSDGTHAFVGMLMAILAFDQDKIYIDEPEAFLHPPLVKRLARIIAGLARDNPLQFFVATHSADFVAGFLSCGVDVNIVRLTHDHEESTARLLDPDALRKVALDPLLRSESTLSALFAEGAIVCESDSDRVLYSEINERLLRTDDDFGLDSVVFLNAQNWQTTARMINPLRRMGVPAAAVLDADALFGGEIAQVFAAAMVPDDIAKSWTDHRAKLGRAIQTRLGSAKVTCDKCGHSKGGSKFNGQAIRTLTEGEREQFAYLLNNAAQYGVFFVPCGELEDWLYDFQIPRSKKALWLSAMLERLGWNPEDPGYVTSTDDDIWGFMRSVARWIRDPSRKGTRVSPSQPSPPTTKT